MLILRNVKKLYDGTAADASAVKEGVDVFIDGGTIRMVEPHDPALSIGESHTTVDASRHPC